MKRARAFAPATVANVAVGFDILGFAVGGLGETAIVERLDGHRGVIVEPIDGFSDILLEPMKNCASAGLVRLIEERELKFGFRIRLEKQIPVGSGLGGSSASAVAAIVAANALLKRKLSFTELFDYALTGEAVASGARHGDNVGPCLKGGMVCIRSHPSLELVPVKTPRALHAVIVLPHLSVRTAEARKILKPQVSLKAMVEQTANLGGFLLGCASGDFSLIGRSLRDVVIEPQRSKLIPGFRELQEAALEAGALGYSISGSGPAMFALVKGPAAAVKVQKALLRRSREIGVELRGTWLSPIAPRGARLRR